MDVNTLDGVYLPVLLDSLIDKVRVSAGVRVGIGVGVRVDDPPRHYDSLYSNRPFSSLSLIDKYEVEVDSAAAAATAPLVNTTGETPWSCSNILTPSTLACILTLTYPDLT